MAMADNTIITLTEYTPLRLPAAALPMQAGEALWQRYGQQISVEFPSPKTEDCWQLTAQGWVGAIPLSRAYTLLLYPRMPLSNLFGMLEYAYDLKSFRLLDGSVALTTLAAFYEQLALVLARRVLDRNRQGPHPCLCGPDGQNCCRAWPSRHRSVGAATLAGLSHLHFYRAYHRQ